MSTVTYTCDCGEKTSRNFWSGIPDNALPRGWGWDYTRIRTGVPQCPACRKEKVA